MAILLLAAALILSWGIRPVRYALLLPTAGLALTDLNPYITGGLEPQMIMGLGLGGLTIGLLLGLIENAPQK